jgi:hypothetical protein
MAGTSLDNSIRRQGGVVLLVTLVLLVVLSILGYMLTSRLVVWRHRNQYIIDYSRARYGCESAVKYALATLEDINSPVLIERPNEPDFSDLFTMDQAQYEEFIAQWADTTLQSLAESGKDVNGPNDVNDVNDIGRYNGVSDLNETNFLRVRGPYGPVWPLITEPVEFEIGSARVHIRIEDENAKYPVGWAMLDDAGAKREARAGLETFCEWMDVNSVQVDLLKRQLKRISEIKPFKLDFKPIVERRVVESLRRSRGSRRRTRRQLVTIPAAVHIADFARLFHGSLIDTDALAKPTVISESRKESALKYMGLWGSSRVNINTAPRQVLETAFIFGGDAVEIAEQIIQRRRIKPFADVEDLRKSLFKYSDSIGKCEKYITTASDFFTIKVTAVSGAAQASAVIAVTKDGKNMEKIAVISG